MPPTRRRSTLPILLLAAALPLACDSAPDGGARGDSSAADTRTPAPAPDTAVPAVAGGPAPTDPAVWVATVRGVGPLQAGMTLAEAERAFGRELAGPDLAPEGCAHFEVPGAPGRVLLMVVDGRVARVEVKDAAIPTDRGARVGDTEARVDSLHAPHVTVEPHKYTDGHYLVVAPASAADGAYRLIFETDGERVLEYRAGRMPEVAWVEGCS